MNKYFTAILMLLVLSEAKAQVQQEDANRWTELNIENDKVKKYMKEVTYDYYTPSVMSDYIGTRTPQDEHPRSIAINLSWLQHDQEYRLTCYEHNKLVLSKNVTAADKISVLTNLLPDNIYSYYVKQVNSTKAERSGYIFTSGQIRMIEFPTLYNTRDLGGWATLDGRRIKYGMLIRGVELHKGKRNIANEECLEGLRKLGVAAELDMRRTYYLPQNSDFADNTIPTESAFGANVPYLCVNMTSIESMLSSYPSKFGDALKFIINNLKEGRPIYYHCVWGADRTGTLSALIEAMLGVSLNDIYKDYELTSFSAYSSTRDKASLNTRLLNVIGYTEGGTKTLQECAVNYAVNRLGVKIEDIIAMQDILLEPSKDVPTTINGSGISNSIPAGGNIYFTPSGVQRTILQHGINIIYDGNGNARKVMAK